MGWHPGERAVQQRAGVAERADSALGVLRADIPPVAQEFLADQRWLVLGAADTAGRMWATVVYGEPGFVTVLDGGGLHVAARPLPGDPLADVLAAPVAELGALAIEPATRRRMRLNGRATPTPDGLILEPDQVYANCPKYIAARSVTDVLGIPERAERRTASVLDGRAAALLAAADTAFVATRAPGHGADASHRGGNPGFLQVRDERLVVWPDYQGNAMFNTLGNLEVDPSCGLTVVDPGDGTTLHVSGSAAIVWDPARIAGFPGAQRLVELRVESVVELVGAAPLRWRLERPARNPPAPVAA